MVLTPFITSHLDHLTRNPRLLRGSLPQLLPSNHLSNAYTLPSSPTQEPYTHKTASDSPNNSDANEPDPTSEYWATHGRTPFPDSIELLRHIAEIGWLNAIDPDIPSKERVDNLAREIEIYPPSKASDNQPVLHEAWLISAV